MTFDNVRLMPPPDADGQTKLTTRTTRDICLKTLNEFSFSGLVLLMSSLGNSQDRCVVTTWIHNLIDRPENDPSWEDVHNTIMNIKSSDSPSFRTIKPRTWLVMGDQTIIGVFNNEAAARDAETYFAKQGVITKLYEIDILSSSPFSDEPRRTVIRRVTLDEESQRVTWRVTPTGIGRPDDNN